MRYLSVSDARRMLADLIDAADGTVITRHGSPVSVLIDYDRYRSMELDFAFLHDPDAARILHQHQQVQAGEVDEFEDLEIELEAETEVG